LIASKLKSALNSANINASSSASIVSAAAAGKQVLRKESELGFALNTVHIHKFLKMLAILRPVGDAQTEIFGKARGAYTCPTSKTTS
jgi:hypothetical protein